MPLLDHFRPPISGWRHWHSFHNSWATYLSSRLNALLPEGYFAEANVQFGVEIDLAAFEESGAASPPLDWRPSPPHATLPVAMPGAVVEVGVFSRSGGPQLAGAIELVSPANKDRPAHREALVSKCAAYVPACVGVVLIDVVTERPADPHRDLLLRLGAGDAGPGVPLYAAAYRPVEHGGTAALEVWHEALAVGDRVTRRPERVS